jgi:UDP-2,4-diacetamido-2,4,6-trideoxy-beta-L-altropyranose hydrolase
MSSHERDDTASAPAHAHWLGTDWETDARQTRSAIGSECADWLVVDHYALDARWERSVRGRCKHLMVIDDLADREHACDLLLDQNLGRVADLYTELIPQGCRVLAGLDYALLRPEFAALRAESLAHRRDRGLRKILVTMGGVDLNNATGKILDALAHCQLPVDCEIQVVMGPHAPWLMSVTEKAATLPWQTEVLVNVRNMGSLMAEADLAIGAAGSTSWERCALGLPAFVVILAENQREAAGLLVASGAAELFELDQAFQANFSASLHRLIDAPSRLRLLSNSAAALCDGQGTGRVVQIMNPFSTDQFVCS